MQGEFVAVASHEVKTPLTSVAAYTEVLLQNIDNPTCNQTEAFLGIIKAETDRLLRLVNRILDLHKAVEKISVPSLKTCLGGGLNGKGHRFEILPWPEPTWKPTCPFPFERHLPEPAVP